MTDRDASKVVVLRKWDESIERLKRAKTFEELAENLGFLFMALKPLIERETATDEDLASHVRDCPARALMTGNYKPVLVALIQQFPMLAAVGFLIYWIVKLTG